MFQLPEKEMRPSTFDILIGLDGVQPGLSGFRALATLGRPGPPASGHCDGAGMKNLMN